jgi:hypothetical protein
MRCERSNTLTKPETSFAQVYSPCFALLVRRQRKETGLEPAINFFVIDLFRAKLAFQNPSNALGTPEPERSSGFQSKGI